MLAVIAAFFALCIAYVWWCDRIIGPDPVDSANADRHNTDVDVDETQEVRA